MGISFAAVLAIGVWVAVAPMLAGWLVIERPIEDPDSIVVLAGGAAIVERNRFAAELYRQGVAHRVLLTNDGLRGGWDAREQQNPDYSELARRELVAGGVPDSAITILPEVVTGTRDEALLISKISAEIGLRRILIVTSPHHTRRAFGAFESVGHPDLGVGIRSPPAVDDRFWYFSANGWRDVGCEYLKLAYYSASF